MMPAAKHFDPVLGVDLHFIVGVGPYPVPHPFVGMILDPFDYLPFIGATVMVNSVPRAQAGTGGVAMPPHIPIGGVFAKPPANECEMFMGSSTVEIDGEAASHLALPVLSCHDVGMLPPPRVKKKSKIKSFVMPTSVVLPIPTGPPVLIGGPPTISLMALGARAGLAALGKGFRKLKKMRKGGKKTPAKASGYGPQGSVAPFVRPDNVHRTLTAVPADVGDLRDAIRQVDALIGKKVIRIAPNAPQAFKEGVYRDLITIATTDTGQTILKRMEDSGRFVEIGSMDLENLVRGPKQQLGPSCFYNGNPVKQKTDSRIYYEPGRLYGKGDDSPSDVVLLHELDHAQRAGHGGNKNYPYFPGTQQQKDWTSREERMAVWTENQYRADRGGVRQRRNYADLP